MIEFECAPPGVAPTRIVIAPGVSSRATPADSGSENFFVCDAALADVQRERLARCVDTDTAAARRIDLEAGEQAKTFGTLERVLAGLATAEIDRTGSLTAVGGGTIGDVAGFAAATYLRGIPFRLIPTTLLSMVDSSVGGKTAINLEQGKNLVGAFWPPREVLIDPEWLSTLPDAEYRSGLGEVLKVAVGLDAELFEICEQKRDAILARDPSILERVIARAVHAKTRVVEQDFRESDTRRLLNLGHTLGHAVESASGYTVPHGVAVGTGIHFAIDVAVAESALSGECAARMRGLLEHYEFGRQAVEASAPRLGEFLRRDKKRSGTTVKFVVPTAIGASATRLIELDQLLERLTAFVG